MRSVCNACCNEQLIVGWMILRPYVDPLDDAGDVRLQLLRTLVRELHHDLSCVGLARLIEHNVHDLGVIVLLDLVELVASAAVSAGPHAKGSRAHTGPPCAPKAWYGRIAGQLQGRPSVRGRARMCASRG